MNDCNNKSFLNSDVLIKIFNKSKFDNIKKKKKIIHEFSIN